MRRSAQDDEFVGGLEYNWFNLQKTRKRSKKSQALRMTILREFDEKHSEQFALWGLEKPPSAAKAVKRAGDLRHG